ncbi:MAG: EipA family protein, partial [Pseudolabrys sp.]
MRATLRLAALTISLVLSGGQFAAAQNPPPPQSGSFTPGELVREGHRFFGTVSRGLAQIVEAAISRWGQPNGYV